MGIRDTLNRNPALTTGLTVGVIAVALAFIVYQIAGDTPPRLPTPQIYFTTDDGKTYFPDDYQKLPPFDVDGKPAVRAYVYSCDGKKTTFVAYLERLTPEAKEKVAAEMQKAGTAGSEGISPETAFQMSEGTEVKRPGDSKWVKRSDPQGQIIQDVKCPSNSPAPLQIVSPGE